MLSCGEEDRKQTDRSSKASFLRFLIGMVLSGFFIFKVMGVRKKGNSLFKFFPIFLFVGFSEIGSPIVQTDLQLLR